jgi:N-acetylglucosamine-6-phosphate deacetylase
VRGWATLTRATLADALYAGSYAAARVIGSTAELGPGQPADLVLLDREGFVRRVMRRGRWLT